MVAQERWVGVGANSCPAPMTRAALLALRAAGGLSTGCHYTITDHVQGRLVAGTMITLHAVSAVELADTALVNTTYDNEGWSGRYDIDAALVYELTDNLNNRVLGAAMVGAFDWGNPAYTDCTIEHSTWTLTIGAPQPRSRVRLLDGSTLNTLGMTGGQLIDVEISKSSTVNLSNGNLSIQRSTITDQCNIVAAGYTAAGSGILRSRFDSQSSFSTGAGAGPVTIQNMSIVSGAIVAHTGSASFTIFGGTVSDSANVTHSGAGAFIANGCFIHGGATGISHTDGGGLRMTGSEIGPYGRILKNGTSTGSLTFNYCVLDTLGLVQQLGGGNMTLTGTKISGNAYVRTLAGSAVPTLTVNYTTLNASAYINMASTATAGNANISNCALDNGGLINKAGTGDLTVTSSNFIGTGRIELNGPRSLNVALSFCSNTGRIVSSATGGAGVIDVVQNSSLQDYGIVDFGATGALPNRLLYSSVRGSTGRITFSGTNTGADASRITADNGIAVFNNNTVAFPNILDIGVRDQGLLTVSGCTAAQDMRYSTVQSYGRWNVTNKTVAGALFGIDVAANGTLTSQGVAADCRHVSVKQGSVVHNGGALLTAVKTMGGTLTTGAFNQNGIQHHVNGNKTLTSANTSRADYQGGLPQLV